MTTRFEETVLEGDPAMRDQTPEEIRPIQMLYRHEQARQLTIDLQGMGLNPEEIEYYSYDFQKNLCPSTGLESESGILYNNRTGVSVGVVLDWTCQYTCGLREWRGEYAPTLDKCQPSYFFTHLSENDIRSLR